MPDNVAVVLEGMPELLRKLERLDTKVTGEIEAAMILAAGVIKDAANPNAPSPHVEFDIVESVGSHVVIDIGPDKKHWYHRFAETGTRSHDVTPKAMAALLFADRETFAAWAKHPGTATAAFLRPAFDSHKNRAVFKAADKLREVISGVAHGR